MNGEITRRELWSQPKRWQYLINRFPETDLPDLALNSFDEIIVFGSGTSYYLAMLLAMLLEQKGMYAKAVPSCELFLHEDLYLGSKATKRLGIGISRSGESSEGLIAADLLKSRDIPLLALGCDADSSLPQTSNYQLIVSEGHEEGMVMLRSFTSMLLGFQLFLSHSTTPFNTIPEKGEKLLDQHASALKILANKRSFNRFVMLGSGFHYPLAVEASLKFQEMAISTSEAYHSLEYRHGPKSTADTNTLAVLFALDGNEQYGVKLVEDLNDYGVSCLVVGEKVEAYRKAASYTIELSSMLSVSNRLVLSLLPVQVLAFETALRLGQNPDSPRNLSAVVKL